MHRQSFIAIIIMTYSNNNNIVVFFFKLGAHLAMEMLYLYARRPVS